ncbi:MAG: hypothetical protein QM611_04065 [Microbacterium sp.]|uniref:hypothetical protein n=1 Tax=Microbacterium sp. TaxID=51671 RepID=UPI0039E559BE
MRTAIYVAQLAERYGDLLAPLVSVGHDDFARGMELFRRHERLGVFDAALAAAVQRRDHVRGVALADRAFAGIPALSRFEPGAPDFAERLGL